MRRLLVLLGVAVSLAGASSAGAATTTVSITNTGFKPQVVTVDVGDTVTWKNNDTKDHQVVSDSGAFTSPVIKPGQSWSATFSKADGYPYRDKLNEKLRGSVNVNAAGGVSISQTGFSPQTVTVAGGGTVTWTNNDTTGASHQVVADDGSFSSPVLKRGATWSHVFENGGTYAYHDGLKPSFTGKVVAGAAPAVAVLLQANRSAVIAGGSVTLSGNVVGGSNDTVQIVVDPVGQSERTMNVTTDSTGAFSVRVAPQIGTTYQAVVKSVQSNTTRAQSSPVSVDVKPRVTLRKVAKGRFSTVVTDLNPIAGRLVYLTRYAPKLHKWVVVASARLRATSNDSVFTAGFRTKLKHVKVRAYLPQSQAGDGYLDGTSNFAVS